MNSSSLISSLIVAVVTPFVITAIRKPTSRFEERTYRIRYFKDIFEMASLVGHSISNETKLLITEELNEADDEIKNLSNKFVSFITNTFTGILIIFLLLVISQITTLAEIDIAKHPTVNSKPSIGLLMQQLSLASLILQSIIIPVCWFWIRWKIRDRIWNGLKMGNFFHFLLIANDQIQKGVELMLLLLVPLTLWLMLTIISATTQNITQQLSR